LNADLWHLPLSLENPLSEMNTQSAPWHKESTCQISCPYAKVFDMISCFQNYNKEDNNKHEKYSKNIMVTAQLARANTKAAKIE
jgi:hypothetical protein